MLTAFAVQLSTHTHLYEDEGEEEEVTLSLPVAIGLLVLSTVLVGVTSEWLVDSIEGVSENYGVPKTFIGLILLPGAWLQHRERYKKHSC